MSRYLLLSMMLAPSLAMADGALMRSQDLGAAEHKITTLVAQARAQNPAMFDAIAKLDEHRPEQYKRSRSQSPSSAAVRFRRLGRDARFALVDLAVFHAPSRDGVTDREWQALQGSLLDSIGLAADPDLTPVLRVTFEHSDVPGLQSIAAVGLGRVGEVRALTNHATFNDVRFAAAVRGLGMTRRPEAVATLAGLLDSANEAQAVEIANALAEAGSSWVWATGKVGSASDEDQVRRTAAEALVRNYARFNGDAVIPMEHAVTRVAHADTKQMIARTTTAQNAARLTHLSSLLTH